MRYGKWLGLLGVLFGVLGALLVHQGSTWGWVFAWPAVSFLLVAITYLLQTPWLLGKRSDGTRALHGYPLAGPFLGFMWLGRQVLLRVSRDEPDWDEVADGVFVGRRVDATRLPEGPSTLIDLTSEFLPHRTVIARTRCFPTLDGSCPRPSALAQWVRDVEQVEGPLYIHCAAGHGRSAMFAACVLVRRGLAQDVGEAVERMQRARPKVHLAPEQRHCAEAALRLLAV